MLNGIINVLYDSINILNVLNKTPKPLKYACKIDDKIVILVSIELNDSNRKLEQKITKKHKYFYLKKKQKISI